jgi:hypothetical protein
MGDVGPVRQQARVAAVAPHVTAHSLVVTCNHTTHDTRHTTHTTHI